MKHTEQHFCWIEVVEKRRDCPTRSVMRKLVREGRADEMKREREDEKMLMTSQTELTAILLFFRKETENWEQNIAATDVFGTDGERARERELVCDISGVVITLGQTANVLLLLFVSSSLCSSELFNARGSLARRSLSPSHILPFFFSFLSSLSYSFCILF